MTDSEHSEDARTYRASSGPAAIVLSGLLAIFLLGDTVLRGSWGQMLLIAPWVLLGLWIVYEISFVSAVRVDAEGATVQNMLRRTSFGWNRVRDIDFRWQLVFSLDDGTDISCYGGPARSRPNRPSAGQDDARSKVPAGVRDLTEIRDRWESAVGADAPITRTWDGPALIALGVIVLWAVGAVLIATAG